MNAADTPPTVFLSYSWDNEEHKAWVKKLAARLRSDGVSVVLDQWELQPGDRLPIFMEAAIRENDFVLIVCTPHYKERSEARQGGVGYEGDIMTGELLGTRNERKFIPLRGLSLCPTSTDERHGLLWRSDWSPPTDTAPFRYHRRPEWAVRPGGAGVHSTNSRRIQ
jgi:hypothetical protein